MGGLEGSIERCFAGTEESQLMYGPKRCESPTSVELRDVSSHYSALTSEVSTCPD